MNATWRFALRLARRETRRRPGRTLLVMLLIAVPVCGMTVVTVLVRSNGDSAAKEFTRQFGAADLVVASGFKTAERSTGAAVAAAFPAGTRVVHVHDTEGFVGLVTASGTARLAEVTDADLNDPISKGAVLLRSGRFPTRAGEALLSPKLAKAFGVKVGDSLRLSTPGWSESIVGIGVRATNWTDGFLDVRGDELSSVSQGGAYSSDLLTLVDLPGHPTNAVLLQYPASYISRATAGARSTDRAVNWIIVGGAVALAIVGIVISGAFAVGARRQLVTLGQLSANGADERLLRRTLSLQGLVSGALGSALGFGSGVAVLLAMHGQFATWIHHDPGPYSWSIRDALLVLSTGIATATIAAFIPARSAARVPVLTALAGRRPLGALPKRLVPVGLALFAGGVFVLALVATASGNRGGNGLAFSAMLGGLLVLAGACCASPVVVAGLGNAAGAARGAARVAVRSVVRSRARSAAVVMALAAVNAGAIAVGTTIDSHTEAKFRSAAFMPDDTLIVSNGGLTPFDPGAVPQPYRPVPATITGPLHKILPDAQWSTRRVVLGTPPATDAPRPAIVGGPGGKIRVRSVAIGPQTLMITDPPVSKLLGLSSRDAAALQSAGAIDVLAQRDSTTKGATSVQVVVGNPPQTVTAAVNHDSVRATGDGDGVFMTEAKARALHLPIVDAGQIVVSPKPFDESQLASIDALSQSLFQGQPGTASANIAWSGTGGSRISPAAVRQIVLGIAVAIALIVLAMSLALSAAETRDERDILVSLGARPSTMRSVSAWKATLLSASGAVVAIPTGFIPVAVVYLTVANSTQRSHIAFPWSTVGQLVIAAPILAGLIAYIGSSIAQTLRPTRMSTFATD